MIVNFTLTFVKVYLVAQIVYGLWITDYYIIITCEVVASGRLKVTLNQADLNTALFVWIIRIIVSVKSILLNALIRFAKISKNIREDK
jgi:hypothetical protein